MSCQGYRFKAGLQGTFEVESYSSRLIDIEPVEEVYWARQVTVSWGKEPWGGIQLLVDKRTFEEGVKTSKTIRTQRKSAFEGGGTSRRELEPRGQREFERNINSLKTQTPQGANHLHEGTGTLKRESTPQKRRCTTTHKTFRSAKNPPLKAKIAINTFSGVSRVHNGKKCAESICRGSCNRYFQPLKR